MNLLIRSLRSIVFVVCGVLACGVYAEDAKKELPKPQVLIKNVNIFDGMNETLKMGQDVLVDGNKIKQIGKDLSADGADVWDGRSDPVKEGQDVLIEGDFDRADIFNSYQVTIGQYQHPDPKSTSDT